MSQRAAVILDKGTPAVVQERPIPTPKDTQMLVKIVAAGVNLVDAYQRDYGIFIKKFPTVLGHDGCGYVEKVGSKVTRFVVGDLIFFNSDLAEAIDPALVKEYNVGADILSANGIDSSVFQEYAIAEELVSVKVPPSITPLEAATFPMCISTAAVAFFHSTGANIPLPLSGPTVLPNSSIVVIGGSSGVGQIGIQLARLAGFSTIVTTASKVHVPFLTSLGATHVFERTVSAKEIIDVAPGVKFVFDVVSPENNGALAKGILAENGGTIIAARRYEGASFPEDIKAKWVFGSTLDKPELAIPLWPAVEKWLAKGELKPNRTLVFEGLEKVDDALTRVKEGVSGVKVVIKIS